MSLVAKFSVLAFGLMCSMNLHARDLYILVVGQSISSNCNEHRYGPVAGVMQIDLSGQIVPASDPFIWADCQQGSMWMPLGGKIISSNFAKTVTFMPIGVAGTSVNDWLPNGKAHGKLQHAIKIVNHTGIRFDYAFWHQGSSDAGRKPEKYSSELSHVLKLISTKIKIDKWIVARHSKCGGPSDEKISNAQLRVGSVYWIRRFPGPETNTLGDEYRYDKCHLNFKGQERMAHLWLESMIKAENINQEIQKETLIHYFKNLLKD